VITETVELTFTDAEGRPVTLAELRGGHRAAALFFMRAGNCLACLRHARNLASLPLAEDGVRAVVVVPGTPADAARVRRTVGERVATVSSTGAEAHLAVGLNRTLLLQHSGTLLVDSTGAVRYRLAATLPTGSFDGPALIDAVRRL